MLVEISYNLYCKWGALQNPSLSRRYANGQHRYWHNESMGMNYKPMPNRLSLEKEN